MQAGRVRLRGGEAAASQNNELANECCRHGARRRTQTHKHCRQPRRSVSRRKMIPFCTLRASQCLSASSACVRSFCSLMAMIAARCFSNSSGVSAASACKDRQRHRHRHHEMSHTCTLCERSCCWRAGGQGCVYFLGTERTASNDSRNASTRPSTNGGGWRDDCTRMTKPRTPCVRRTPELTV